MPKFNFNNAESRRRGQQAALAARQALAAEIGKETIRNGEVSWHIPRIDLVSVPEFEQMLIQKFGPEYLEPIPYRCTDGAWAPVTEEVHRETTP